MNEEEIRNLLHPDCKIVPGKTWGDWVAIEKQSDADVVIIALNEGWGLQPAALCLPHQVYLEKLVKLCENKSVKQITLIPVRSKNYAQVTEWKQ